MVETETIVMMLIVMSSGFFGGFVGLQETPTTEEIPVVQPIHVPDYQAESDVGIFEDFPNISKQPADNVTRLPPEITDPEIPIV